MDRKPSIKGLVVAEPTSYETPSSDSELVAAQMIGIPQPDDEILGGKYRIERVIGVGGMGVVVAAVHQKLDQRVAIKFLSRTMQTPELVDRFIREGQACARIKSEHIASVLDVGVLDNGTPYLMMEHLEGVDLDGYLTGRGTLPVEDAVDFVLQACDALAVAHSAGIVHRDLKPSNLFVTQRSDGSPLIKVLDFGISKIGQSASHPNPKSTLTRPGTMLGSPRYMSPEQLRNASGVDHRADVWAMGIVLHELVAGEPPYVSDTFAGLCAMITADPPVPLRALQPEVPELLERVILKCLEKNPVDRWQSVADLALALVPLASEESRVIALRVSKILGFVSSKTPAPGSFSYSSARPGASSASSRSRPDPLAASGRASNPSDPTMARDSSRSLPGAVVARVSPTDSNVAALSVSSVQQGRSRGARIGGILALVALLVVVAVGSMTFGRRRAASAPPEEPARTLATVAAPAPPAPEAPEAPLATQPTEATPPPTVVTTPLPSVKAALPVRAKAKAAQHAAGSASVTAAGAPTTTSTPPSSTLPSAPPSEADMLNRRR